MNDLVVEIVSGLATGGIYALLALGLALIYQVSQVVNFAQGALAAVGAYLTWSLSVQAGLPFWPAAILAVVALFMLGVGLQVALPRRLERAPAASVIVTLGLLIVLQGGVGVIWGNSTPLQTLTPPIAGYPLIAAGPFHVSPLDLASIGVSIGVIALFFAFLRWTRAGASLRAVSQSIQGARLVGIGVDRVRLMAWGISAVIAGVAGVLILTATLTQQSPSMAQNYLLSAFAGAVIGGLDSLVGAAVAALLLGVVQNLVGLYVSTEWNQALVFLLLLVVLLLRPAGLFGVAVQRRV